MRMEKYDAKALKPQLGEKRPCKGRAPAARKAKKHAFTVCGMLANPIVLLLCRFQCIVILVTFWTPSRFAVCMNILHMLLPLFPLLRVWA